MDEPITTVLFGWIEKADLAEARPVLSRSEGLATATRARRRRMRAAARKPPGVAR